MSGLTPIALVRFRDQLGTRGSSFERLADEIGCGRSHVSQVLHGHRLGGDTWPLIRAVVTDGEWATLLQMEHCATWNTAQCALGDGVFVWRMRVRCGWCRQPQGFKACARAAAGKTTHSVCPVCFEARRHELEALNAGAKPEVAVPESRAYLVRTDAGLQVHHSTSRPALADDRELSPAFVNGDAAHAPIRCALGTRLSR